MKDSDAALLARVKHALDTNPLAVERAVTVLFARQTQDEQQDSTTRHSNLRGFNSPDAYKMSYYARWIASGHRLTGNNLDKARVTVRKYWRQLLEEAKAKQAKS